LTVTRVAGVDGTKGGWVALVLDEREVIGDRLIRPVETDFPELRGCGVIAIDVPIGFGPREVDRAARAYLRGAASTVFSTPSKDVLEQPYGPGLGVSAQAHALGPRILHVTELAAADSRLHEVHPEVSFRAMNGGRALRFRKKSAGGALERLALLRAHGIELAALSEAGSAPLDDVLDAAAAAWSARRIAAGIALTLPREPQVVERRPIAIWY
jgi:predicted RNase H-like nuclease